MAATAANHNIMHNTQFMHPQGISESEMGDGAHDDASVSPNKATAEDPVVNDEVKEPSPHVHDRVGSAAGSAALDGAEAQVTAQSPSQFYSLACPASSHLQGFSNFVGVDDFQAPGDWRLTSTTARIFNGLLSLASSRQSSRTRAYGGDGVWLFVHRTF
jgi:hypothetical protein